MAFSGKGWTHGNTATTILVCMAFGLQLSTCLGEKSSSYKPRFYLLKIVRFLVPKTFLVS